jgi:hypothetical protein
LAREAIANKTTLVGDPAFFAVLRILSVEAFAERKSRESSIGSHYFVSHEIEHRGFQFRSSMRGFGLASSNVAEALSATDRSMSLMIASLWQAFVG